MSEPLQKNYIFKIKETLYQYRGISRTQLAALLSLSAPSVTAHINTLKTKGYVREVEPENWVQKGAGRKPMALEYIPDSAYAMGMEVSPFQTTVMVTDMQATPIYKVKRPIASDRYSEALQQIKEWAFEAMESTGLDRTKLLGLAVASPGYIDEREGIVKQTYRQDWMGRQLAADVFNATGIPTVVNNNAKVRALMMDLLFRSEVQEPFAYFYASKGISCPFVMGSQELTGQAAGAGEIGHMVMAKNGRHCDVCGNNGCLEAYSSENAILSRCRNLMGYNKESFLNHIVAGPDQLTMSEVLKAQEYGDPDVCRVMNEAIEYMGIAIANIINFVSPATIVVDAYTMKMQANRDLLLKTIHANLLGLHISDVKIKFLDFDEFRGVHGACAYALKSFFVDCR